MTTKRDRQIKLWYDRLEAEYRERAALAELNVARAELAHMQKERDRLNAAPADPISDIWCADLTTDLNTDDIVGTIEIPDERTDGVLIQPGHEGNAVYNPARDGQLQPALDAQPFNAYYNRALLPARQRNLPGYRLGEITALDTGNDTANVLLDPAESSEGPDFDPIDVNINQTLTNIPVEYLTCNAAAFAVGDRCVVKFEDLDPNQPKVIGFESNPKPCDISGNFLTFGATQTTDDGTLFNNRYQRLSYDDVAGDWVADDSQPIESRLADWRSPSGEVLSWNMWYTRYWPWIQRDFNHAPTGAVRVGSIIEPDGIFSGRKYFGGSYFIYLDGVEISDTMWSNDWIAGAAIIDDNGERFLVACSWDIGDGGGHVIEIDVRIARESSWPITSNSSWYFIGKLVVNSRDENDITPDDYFGPYRNYQPWFFNSTGRKAVSLIWDEVANKPFRYVLEITGSGHPQDGGTLAAVFTQYDDVFEVGESWGSERKRYTRPVENPAEWVAPVFNNGIYRDLEPRSGFTQIYLTEITDNDQWRRTKHAIAYDWNANDEIVALMSDTTHGNRVKVERIYNDARFESFSGGETVYIDENDPSETREVRTVPAGASYTMPFTDTGRIQNTYDSYLWNQTYSIKNIDTQNEQQLALHTAARDDLRWFPSVFGLKNFHTSENDAPAVIIPSALYDSVSVCNVYGIGVRCPSKAYDEEFPGANVETRLVGADLRVGKVYFWQRKIDPLYECAASWVGDANTSYPTTPNGNARRVHSIQINNAQDMEFDGDEDISGRPTWNARTSLAQLTLNRTEGGFRFGDGQDIDEYTQYPTQPYNRYFWPIVRPGSDWHPAPYGDDPLNLAVCVAVDGNNILISADRPPDTGLAPKASLFQGNTEISAEEYFDALVPGFSSDPTARLLPVVTWKDD